MNTSTRWPTASFVCSNLNHIKEQTVPTQRPLIRFFLVFISRRTLLTESRQVLSIILHLGRYTQTTPTHVFYEICRICFPSWLTGRLLFRESGNFTEVKQNTYYIRGQREPPAAFQRIYILQESLEKLVSDFRNWKEPPGFSGTHRLTWLMLWFNSEDARFLQVDFQVSLILFDWDD